MVLYFIINKSSKCYCVNTLLCFVHYSFNSRVMFFCWARILTVYTYFCKHIEMKKSLIFKNTHDDKYYIYPTKTHSLNCTQTFLAVLPGVCILWSFWVLLTWSFRHRSETPNTVYGARLCLLPCSLSLLLSLCASDSLECRKARASASHPQSTPSFLVLESTEQ